MDQKREIIVVNGIAAYRVDNWTSQKVDYDSWFPKQLKLKALRKLPPGNSRVKLFIVLWTIHSMVGGGWFRLKNTICKEYGITRSEKSRLLNQWAEAGVLELDNQKGRTVRVKMK